MATEITETERKYDAPQGAAVPDLADLPQVAAESDPEEQTLRAEYYDTDDLRLIRNGITLRRRTGGNDAGWHLKLPLGGDSRSEIRLPPGRASRQVPAELAQLVLAFTRGRPLRPVAQISTVRQRRLLLDDAGGSLAGVVADDVSARALGDGAAESRWHEVEVELTGGGPRLLEAADRRLRRSGLRPAGRQAQLGRALAARPSPAGPPSRPPQAGRRRAGGGRSWPAAPSPPARAGSAVLEALGSDRSVALLEALDGLLADPPLTPEAGRPAAEALPPTVRRARRRLRQRMRRARSTPAGPDRDAALHDARKAAKHARYSAEAVSPVFGRPAPRFANPVPKVQPPPRHPHPAPLPPPPLTQPA